MHSALYCGWLEHRRRRPRPHAFRYRLFMLWLDLAELEQVFRGRWLWSTSGPALARFERRDHLGDPALPLAEAVRRLVAERTGRRPAGPIRLLTHLRYFGYVFNPVCFYYCYDSTDSRVETVVAEVNNTPWGERHCYVLEPDQATMTGAPGALPAGWSARSAKAMHVSPFMPMELQYRWRFGPPGKRLGVGMQLLPPAGTTADAAPLFAATLAMRRVPIDAGSLAGMLLRYPLMTASVIVAIHWQALRLWLKGVPVHTHPAARATATAAAPPT